MKIHSTLASVVLGLTFLPVHAQNAKTVLGTLTCTAAEGETNRFADRAVVLSCLFSDSEGGYAETYSGTLRRQAGAKPIDKSIVFIWTVSGESGTLAPGILEQRYLGSSASGDPENRKLLGQKNAAIVLQPLIKSDQAAEDSVTTLDLDLELTRAHLGPKGKSAGVE